VGRSGRPLTRDIIIAFIAIILILEASRRIIGKALSIIAILFSIYAFFGPYMPSILAYKGVSLTKYVTQLVLSTEGIYGIPLDVSAQTVFLFVLLGAMLDKVGAGTFFNDLSISLLGRFKGGPAKAAVVSSGFTGLFSGSSIANVVTTGTFTIPLMKKVGYPGKIAAATEVAASTNGQLMPPIMGAAAFIIAEYLAVPYIEVIKAAAIPAFVSYFALFYIVHLEASKLNMQGLPKSELPNFFSVIKKGYYFLIPLIVLIYQLVVLRYSPKLGAFNAIVILVVIVLIREIYNAIKSKKSILSALKTFLTIISDGLKAGSRNMLSVALATATAGIVVGIVNMGIGSMIVQIVEVLSMGNIFLLLVITAIASLILGMGLPTTATYIVMASITVPVIITLSQTIGMNPIHAISAHLFCFYFGILADDTPPVGLAAYAAAAIAKSDAIKTGIQGFIYDLRTAVIPFMFVFNPELVLVGVSSFPQIMLIFVMAIFGSFAFTNAVQGWFIIKNKWYEFPFFAVATVILFYPSLAANLLKISPEYRYYFYIVGLMIYAIPYVMQKFRMRRTAVDSRGFSG
jgi:TRAP transporter 4TM/12TM fusion protein